MKGKGVLVTGGGSGIGYAVAKAFAREGANVHLCDREENLVNQLSENEPGLTAHLADAADEDAVNQLFDTVLEQLDNQLDVLVNNVGISGQNGPLETLDANDWSETLRVNVVSAFLCSKRAIPVMKQRNCGSIVNLSSTAGIQGYPLRTPYTASKWAIVGLTKTMAMELGTYGIRVNAICPGPVSGPRIDRVINAEAETLADTYQNVRAKYEKQVSMRCFVEAEDIAEMILFICSDKGAKISGQALAVDGHTESLAL